jgi:uncharacterized membrane protein
MFNNLISKLKDFIKNQDNQMWLFIALLIAAVLFFVVSTFSIYSRAFGHYAIPDTASHSNLSNIRAEWGQIGDFFGGILNPLFGFVSLFALLVTIAYQARSLRISSEELRLSREELSKSSTALAAQNKAIELQSFEQTFFSWLNTYRDLLNSVTENSTQSANNTKGRDQLYKLWNSHLSPHNIIKGYIWDYSSSMSNPVLKNEFKNDYGSNFESLGPNERLELIADFKPDIVSNVVLNCWRGIYIGNEYQFDSLFRTLYRLLVWIDSQRPERLNRAEKWLYISIVRSQLSAIEMKYLYFNGLTEVGKKFKPIIEKYALFDNLKPESDTPLKILKVHLHQENYYLDEAFNSELARQKLHLPISLEETLANAHNCVI